MDCALTVKPMDTIGKQWWSVPVPTASEVGDKYITTTSLPVPHLSGTTLTKKSNNNNKKTASFLKNKLP